MRPSASAAPSCARRCRSCRRPAWWRRATASAPSSSPRRGAACSGIDPTDSATSPTWWRCSSCASASRPKPPGWPRSAAPTTTCRDARSARRFRAQRGGAGDAVAPTSGSIWRSRGRPATALRRLMSHLGTTIIPRARLTARRDADRRGEYLRRVNAEHEEIFDAIARHDAEGGARRDAHPPGQQPRAAAPGAGGGASRAGGEAAGGDDRSPTDPGFEAGL